jgi:hypothetical protein
MNRRLSPICRKQVACRNNINICIYLYEKTSIVWEAKYGTYGKKMYFTRKQTIWIFLLNLKKISFTWKQILHCTKTQFLYNIGFLGSRFELRTWFSSVASEADWHNIGNMMYFQRKQALHFPAWSRIISFPISISNRFPISMKERSFRELIQWTSN